MWYDKIISVQRISTLANLVLIAMVAYIGVGLCYQWIGLKIQPKAPIDEAMVPSDNQGRTESRPVSFYQPVVDRDLFKTRKAVAARPQAKPVDLEGLEETQLNLKLWGTVSGDIKTAYAVIEDLQKREQNLYRVGDSVQDATVKMILREKVVLTVAGRDEVLAMEEMSQAGSTTARPALPAAQTPRPFPNAPPREQRISIQRSMIDESLQDVNKLMSEIAIRPHEEGLSLSNIKPNSVFRRMGLRNGDILLGINGKEIRSVEDAMQLYDGLRSASEVQVQLKRRGQERSISYNIR